MIYRYLFVFWLLLIGIGPALAQQLTPAQQAELDKAAREAKAEFEKVTDPAYMSRLFDEQIRDARKNGASPELIRELEQAKKDALKQLRELKANPNPQPAPEPADNTASDKAQTDLLASLKNRMARPDTSKPVMYDVEEGHYGRIPASFRVYAEAKLTPVQFVAFMQKTYGVTLEEERTYTFDKQTTIRYRQLYAGYRVALARYSATLDATGYVSRASGDLLSLTATAPDVRPPTQLLAALRTATKLPTLPLVPDNPATVPPTYAQALPPVWMSPRLNPALPSVLTQPFDVLTPTSEERWYIQVQTGAVVATETLRRTCKPDDDPPGQYVRRIARTFFAQNRPVGVFKTITHKLPVYKLIDSTESPKVFIQFPGTDQAELTKDSTLADQSMLKRGCFDALFGFRQSAAYFKRLGLSGYDGANADIVAESVTEQNAYWSSKYKRFGYGIVNGKPYVNLHTIGHEFTHAVNEFSAGFIYEGESGALDESISDMFGTCIEHTVLGGNWVLDEEIWVERGGIRNMADPPAKNHPDTYGETNWADPANIARDLGGVHINSGIGNKWFYLLIKGGKGQNDLKHPYIVAPTFSYGGLARLLLATLPKLAPRSGYEDFCRETIATSEAQYGECSKQTEAVKQAWYAVGVLDDPPAPCKPGWSMDMVMKGEGQRQVIKLYFKGDSSVSVTRTPDAIVKTFTRKSSPVINMVLQNEEGLNTGTVSKDIMGYVRNVTDNIIPAMEVAYEQQIKEARAELANPETSPERRADIRRGLPVVENLLQQVKAGAADIKREQADLEAGSIPQTDLQFWETRKARRQFDKDHITRTQRYEDKYLAKKYEMPGGIYWWTTAQIPLRMSDLMQSSLLIPASLIQNGLDHWLRGFPIQYHEVFRIQNIREAAPANFDTLFSMAPVFD